MMDHIELARAEIVDAQVVEAQVVEAQCEARFPVAYSHGGFAQVRHALPMSDLNPLAPIQVPTDFDPTLTASYGNSAVVFLRS